MTSTTSAIVGALACQKSSFLKTYNATVVSSFEFKPPLTSKEKQEKNKKSKGKEPEEPPKLQYAIELSDTILFPEGGGQPYDTGSLLLPDDQVIEVQSVLRDKLKALHLTDKPLSPGTEVKIELNWERRLDLMQQHTGQHLLSAIFDTYDLETLSWSMGEMINYIELPRKVSDEIVEEVNRKVNEAIFQGIPISVTHPYKDGHEIDLSHIPEDYDTSKGIVRIVQIGDLDSNPCCGTHLGSTSQIQAITLLHQTNVRGGNSRLHFLCGSRVYKYLKKQNDILKSAGSQLSCQVEEVSEKISQLNVNYKKSTSRESNLIKELANIEAFKVFNEFNSTDKLVEYVYRADSNSEFLLTFQKEMTTLINSVKESKVNLNDQQTIVLINGDYQSGTGGMIKIIGPQSDNIQKELKNRISNLKGGGKSGSYQGKVTKYEKGELESVLNYLDSFRD